MLLALLLISWTARSSASRSSAKGSVAIINTVPFHEELYPAFHFAWRQAGYRVRTFVHPRASELGMTNITRSWNFDPVYLKDPETFSISIDEFRHFKAILILNPEWEETLIEKLQKHRSRANMLSKHSRIFLLYHGCENCEFNPSVPLARIFVTYLELFPAATVLALAPHAADHIRSILWLAGFPQAVDYVIPLFPVDLSPPLNHSGFVLQGYLDVMMRRNYSIVKNLAELKTPQDPNMTLRVMGYRTGYLASYESSVLKITDNAPYPEYYSLIHGALGMLTAFGDPRYVTKKASSSVSASLICGTPLLTELKVIQKYTFISRGSIWIRNEDETYVSAMKRTAALPDLHDQYLRRQQSLLGDIRRAYERNREFVQTVMGAGAGADGGVPGCAQRESKLEAFVISPGSSSSSSALRSRSMKSQLRRMGLRYKQVEAISRESLFFPRDLQGYSRNHTCTVAINNHQISKDSNARVVVNSLCGPYQYSVHDIAVTASNLLAIREAVYSETARSDYAVILEDQTYFPIGVDFEELIDSVGDSDFGVLQLCTNNPERAAKAWDDYNSDRSSIWEPWHKFRGAYSAGAYIINRKAIRSALASLMTSEAGSGPIGLMLCQAGQVCRHSDLLAQYLIFSLVKSFTLTVPVFQCGFLDRDSDVIGLKLKFQEEVAFKMKSGEVLLPSFIKTTCRL
jgi:hypothetical protein